MTIPTEQELLDRIAQYPGIIQHDLMQIVAAPMERQATRELLLKMEEEAKIRSEENSGPERKYWVRLG